MLPSLYESTISSFFSVDKLDEKKRSPTIGVEGEALYELRLELNPLKTIYQRVHTSFLYLCAILAGAAICIYWALDLIFQLIISTQGDAVKQALLWGLYQIRRTKTLTLKSR